ncbi:MAG: peptide deformylase [Lachnospirales bacterium]
MAIREFREIGEDILYKKSKAVKEITGRVIELLDDMAVTMEEYNGIGLAAVQVGMLKRIFIILYVEDVLDENGEAVLDDDNEPLTKEEIIEFINPEILERRGSQINIEGCLSVPGKSGNVERPEYVKMKAMDREGNEFIVEYEGYYATVVSHEYDHLDGILYVDKVIDEECDKEEE